MQVMYQANNDSSGGLLHDLFTDDPAAFLRNLRRVIDEVGAKIRLGSVHQTAWHPALWLYCAAGGSHGYRDGMNLGFFAKGLDLFGFWISPVEYDGWGSTKSKWYTMSAAHNTVVVDGKDHFAANGVTTL